jgi:predicted DNA-binding transcriptional regulator AlpA
VSSKTSRKKRIPAAGADRLAVDYQDVDLLTDAQTTARLGLADGTLAVWRSRKRYPLPYVKLGRLVRYRARDVEDFLAARTHSGNGDERPVGS